MDNDWRECVNTDHLYVMTIKVNISQFCSNVIFTINTITVVFYLLGGYAVRFMHISGDYNDTWRQLPIKVQFPFETQQSPIFELVAVSLFLHVTLNSLTLSVLNALIATLVSFIIQIIVFIYHKNCLTVYVVNRHQKQNSILKITLHWIKLYMKYDMLCKHNLNSLEFVSHVIGIQYCINLHNITYKQIVFCIPFF